MFIKHMDKNKILKEYTNLHIGQKKEKEKKKKTFLSKVDDIHTGLAYGTRGVLGAIPDHFISMVDSLTNKDKNKKVKSGDYSDFMVETKKTLKKASDAFKRSRDKYE